MRLCSPLPAKFDSPEEWVNLVKSCGYSADNAPVGPDATDDVAAAYSSAAKASNIVIAEVGAWSNPISPDSAQAAAALEKCISYLANAERLAARCCVNVTGSRNPDLWAGPHPDNFMSDTFDLIVETTRKIVDAVKPKRTSYTIETMPWIFPSSPDEYLELVHAIDRPGVAVHLDPVNMINTPSRIFRTADFLRECFEKLGPLIKSCHAKDITIGTKLTVHLDECRPGTGFLDYSTYLRELSKLDPDTTLFIEHLSDEDYPIAAEYIRGIARLENIQFA